MIPTAIQTMLPALPGPLASGLHTFQVGSVSPCFVSAEISFLVSGAVAMWLPIMAATKFSKTGRLADRLETTEKIHDLPRRTLRHLWRTTCRAQCRTRGHRSAT